MTAQDILNLNNVLLYKYKKKFSFLKNLENFSGF